MLTAVSSMAARGFNESGPLELSCDPLYPLSPVMKTIVMVQVHKSHAVLSCFLHNKYLQKEYSVCMFICYRTTVYYKNSFISVIFIYFLKDFLRKLSILMNEIMKQFRTLKFSKL